MFQSSSQEKRCHKRFFVRGVAKLRIPPGDFSDQESEIINFGRGGMLLLSKAPPPLQTELEIRFRIQGFHREILAKGRVVRHEPGVLAVEFPSFEVPQDIKDLAVWLEAELMATFF